MTGASALGAVGIGGSLLSGILGASGAEQQGAAQQQMYDYQAGIAKQNAQIAQQNANYSLQQGEQQAQTYGLQAAQKMGQIKAAQASSGLDVNSGSAVQVRASQQTVTGIDLDQIRSNAAKTAYNYDVQSVQDTEQANLYTSAGSNAAAAANINASASILGATTSVASKWLAGNQSGMFGSGGSGSTVTNILGVSM